LRTIERLGKDELSDLTPATMPGVNQALV